MKKISVIGCPVSGKTTLANELGVLLNAPVYHLDKIFWVKKEGIKQDVFIAQQNEMMKGDKWVMDGHFWRSKSFDLRLEKSDTIIFFDLPKRTILWRLFKRTIKNYGKTRHDMPENEKGKFDWKLFKYIWGHSTEEIYPKILLYAKSKKVVIIKNNKDRVSFLEAVNSEVKKES